MVSSMFNINATLGIATLTHLFHLDWNQYLLWVYDIIIYVFSITIFLHTDLSAFAHYLTDLHFVDTEIRRNSV